MKFPILHELVTGVSVVAKSTVGTVCLPFSEKTADKWFSGAEKDIVSYGNTSLIGGSTKALVQVLKDDEEGAKRTMSGVKRTFEDTLDKTPIVGHVKGVFHLAGGDKEAFKKCMKDATRTSAVVASAAMTGGAGLVVAGTTSAACGTAYDATISAASDESYGLVKTIEDGVENKDPSSVVDVLTTVGTDFVTGAAVSKATGRSASGSNRVTLKAAASACKDGCSKGSACAGATLTVIGAAKSTKRWKKSD